MNISDRLSHLKMNWLTGLGRSILPAGYWGEQTPSGLMQSGDENTTENKSLYLTFDDGPNPRTTESLLELLSQENVPATFFLIGSEIGKYPELTELIHQAGHTVGNHSFNHNFMPSLPTRLIEREIQQTNTLLQEINGRAPTLFRPPYGMIDQRGADCLKEANMTIVYWGCVPEDWHGVGTERVVARVCQQLSGGTLIVLHEGNQIAKQTIEATREIVLRAKAQGYTFKTLPEQL
jgi:peptidoglycan/xylan/chitin deacetylase (PgdA/CDA1 family)